MKRILTILVMFVFSVTYCANSFIYGEKATYNAYWTGIKVGTVVMEVSPKDQKSTDYTFKMTMKTSSFADKFYSSRQTIISTINNALTQPISYSQKGREKKKNREIKVDFDWKSKKSKYYKNGKFSKEMDLEPGMLDPLSIFYFFRTQEMSIGKLIDCKVIDGKKIVNGYAVVTREEKIKTDKFGKVDTFVIEPELEGLGGVFGNSNDSKLEIWFAKSGSRLPVKIKSKVKVGSFTVELEKIEGASL